MIKKVIGLLSVVTFACISIAYTQDYTFYYGDGCPHCANVEDFFGDNNTLQSENIVMKEVYKDATNREEFLQQCQELAIAPQDQGIPMLLIESGDGKSCIIGDGDIIKHFEEKNTKNNTGVEIGATNLTGTTNTEKERIEYTRAFFGILIPAAISDSINPCIFTVMLLLLLSILSKTNSRRKAVLAGLLFALAVFITYFTLGLLFAKGVSGLASGKTIFRIELGSGILGILVGLANLKDYFWYGKGFVMEVPFSRRPTMKKIIEKATSLKGVFFVGLVVSVFIAPCSSGPYFSILGPLGSSKLIEQTRGVFLLFIYNIIFILPMLVIVVIVGLGIKTPKELAVIKNKNTELIHLIVGLLMLGLGIYLILRAI